MGMIRRWAGGVRLLLAALCALGLLGRAAGPVLAMPALSAALLSESGICHGVPGDDGAPGPAGDCAACPICHPAGHADVPAPPVLPAGPSWVVAEMAPLPAAESPVRPETAPFLSRGPPTLG